MVRGIINKILNIASWILILFIILYPIIVNKENPFTYYLDKIKIFIETIKLRVL